MSKHAEQPWSKDWIQRIKGQTLDMKGSTALWMQNVRVTLSLAVNFTYFGVNSVKE